ncbi:MAG: hypothetical protein H0X25_14620 [Acidobacteriales bacterium]|nr:hypothetical protein [Terriglobales bacterium]
MDHCSLLGKKIRTGLAFDPCIFAQVTTSADAERPAHARNDPAAELTQSRAGGVGAGTPGRVFKITPAGALTTLHTFAATDGVLPYGGLTLGADGNFYGTTELGGLNRGGTVFRAPPDLEREFAQPKL